MATSRRGSQRQRRVLRGQAAGNLEESTFDSEIVPSSLVEIEPILRVANEVEQEDRRVAYLCRLYAFEKAHKLDPSSSGRGVRQFKTELFHRLKMFDPELMGMGKLQKKDARQMQSFYHQYYKYIQVLQNVANKADHAKLAKAYQTAAILFEVLRAINGNQSVEVDHEILETHNKVEEKKQALGPFNIIPLDLDSANQAVMLYPEIQAVVIALQNTRGLPWPKDHKKKIDEDIFDWLQLIFGFQMDNASNQREHLILLLANAHIQKNLKLDQQPKLDDRALDDVMKKLFKNYKRWCKYLDRSSSLWMPAIQQEVQQRKLLYMGLYLLIWGEAANLRFMPECLCYIYHHMAFELYGMLAGNVCSTGENNRPAYGGNHEAFLKKVVMPIYDIIAKEAEKSKTEKSKHYQWRNYDDLNEYFWSDECFYLGWPMRVDDDFFYYPWHLHDETNEESKIAKEQQWIGKVNFVEIRSFWHVFRSFDRMWSFFILSLQVMIILAWKGGSPSGAFDPALFKAMLSIFISAAILKLGQSILDIMLSWKARRSMSWSVKLRYILKVIAAVAWVIILPVTFAYTVEYPTGLEKSVKSWFGAGQNQPSLYVSTVAIYLSPNILSVALFLFPSLRPFLEGSNYKIIKLMMWWSQPSLFVGRGMHEGPFSLFMYTLFWVLLILTKLVFSYYIEIKPLVGATKDIMRISITTFKWHEFFPRAKNNIGVIIALWAPIILVYFMDTQIWYAIFSTLVGGIYGAYRHLGEIRSLGLLRSRFESLPAAFNLRLVPADYSGVNKKNGLKTFSRPFGQMPNADKEVQPKDAQEKRARFAQIWNTIISNFRKEDLISNREMDLLLVPYWADRELDLPQWPPFLLAGKIPVAVHMAKDTKANDNELTERLKADSYMSSAVHECYLSCMHIIDSLIDGDGEKEVITKILDEVNTHIQNRTLIGEFQMEALPDLYELIVKLIGYLMDNKEEDHPNVVLCFQDMLEVVINDIMKESSILDFSHGGSHRRYEGIAPLDDQVQLFASPGAIIFPYPASDAWTEKIKRLFLLLTVKESAMDVPTNLEARRRISFFSNSLFMDMPDAPKVRNMLSFSVLTPYHNEDVLFSLSNLKEPNADGVSIIFYLQKIYPDEWNNLLERVECKTEKELRGSERLKEELCLWASCRGQTLIRTVRGMMYYRKALELQAFLDMAKDEDLMEGYKTAELMSEEDSKFERSLWAQCQAIADMKFTYVVSCQQYGIDKRSGHPRAQDIQKLMRTYPSLRVAYIDEVEVLTTGRTTEKVYYSVLVKASLSKTDYPSEQVRNLDQEIYRIKLPGPAILGEGKPENQNHAIIFTRGEGLQTIDMNQDNYMEEAFKMRNLLQEFLKKHDGGRYPSILGVREHIFTGSVSSLAWFMSNQEHSFVTIGQRLLANPLKVRFHYGHPDVFDRLFHLTRGGVSKASKIINLSEDVFAGINSTLRQGNVTHHEYMQVGKGRDVGLNQISLFEANIASGNGEQTLSRDIYRLGQRFDFFRMLSCYFTTVGFYFSNLVSVLTVYVFLYGRLYLVLSGLEEGLATGRSFIHNRPLQVALASQSLVQLGFLVALPMVIEVGLEKGFRSALSDFILMQLQLASVFFTFSLGTKAHYYGRTLLHGGAEYRGTGRGFVVFHAKFADNYRLYSRSHFVKGIELLLLLIVYEIFGQSYRSAVAYTFITFSMWFMVGAWLFAPFLFNPSGFEWQKIVDDWTDWSKWISNRGGIGVSAEKSWESWWDKEQEHLKYSGMCGILIEILLALRFFIYQYGLVYHLNMTKKTRNVLVYGISWLAILVVLLVMKTISVGRRRFSAKFQLVFRLIKFLIFVTFVSILVTLIALPHMTPQDIIVCFLAFVPTGWGMLLIAQACKPLIKWVGLWSSVRALARGYEIMMGLFLFTPIAFLAWFPFVSEFQTRVLFNQGFSRGLPISRILGVHKRKEQKNPESADDRDQTNTEDFRMG